LTYQWESSSGNLTGGHYKGVATNTIAIDSVLISDTSTYTCLVADAAGDTVLSSGARLTVKTYIVKFNSNGGSVVDSQKTACNTPAITPSMPAKTGYRFSGWYSDSAFTSVFNFSSPITANITLYAKWLLMALDTVTFDSRGGSVVTSQAVNYGTTTTAPPAPAKNSYTFAGWYSDTALTTLFTFSSPITASITLYAKWEIRDVEGNVYHEVAIGIQVWMVENLRTTRLNDSTAIPLVTAQLPWAGLGINYLSNPGYCWYSNDSVANATYGPLYNWFCVNTGKLAPKGWHVPTDFEWSELSFFLGGDSVAGGKLKEAGLAHWQSPNTGATNETGFSALPGGERDDVGDFYSIGSYGTWWSSTASMTENYIWGRSISSVNPYLHSFLDVTTNGFSIRCIRD
jgi:uncharacterized protein (TIGR02145 family)/uncharacterized repeat protein (TIGR02543 family)